MAKPTGSVCNLDCKYCFYLEKEKLYPERNRDWKMDDKTLELFIKQQIEAQPNELINFAWQGGEPTLMGLDYFERVAYFCEKYGEGKEIQHSFQTNGVLINDSWCEFFKKNNFLIGISIDGPEDIHDHYRLNRAGRGTHSKVVEAVHLLKKHGVLFNTLTVLNSVNVKQPLAIYKYLKSLGSDFMQFIPIVERSYTDDNIIALIGPNESVGEVTKWSVSPQEYGTFLSEVFDFWVRHDVGKVFIQTFDSTLAAWLGQPSGVCITAETCGHAFALEANGDLYQCDHYVYPEYKLGNIHDTTITEMNKSKEAIDFGVAKRQTLTQDCIDCRYLAACYGGCPKHRFSVSKTGLPEHNYLCKGYEMYFSHAEKYMKTMASLIMENQPASNIMTLIQAGIFEYDDVGRNEPCPCGSGKKYKKCCI